MKAVSLSSPARVVVLLCALFSCAARADLFEADFGSGIIYRIPANGSNSVYTTGLNAPEGMAFDSAGNFYVSTTGGGIIYKFITDGTQTVFATGLNGPASLAFDGAGNLFEADFFGNVIYKFTPDGSRTTFATGLNRPANLLFHSGGDLFVTDFGSGPSSASRPRACEQRSPATSASRTGWPSTRAAICLWPTSRGEPFCVSRPVAGARLSPPA